MQKLDLLKEAVERKEWRYFGAKGSSHCGQLHRKSPDKKSRQSHLSIDQTTKHLIGRRCLGSLARHDNRAAMLYCNNTLLLIEAFKISCYRTGLSHCRMSKTFVLGLVSLAVQGGTWHPEPSSQNHVQNLAFRDKPEKCNYTHCRKHVVFLLSSANNMPISIFSESRFPLYLVLSSPFFTGKNQ